MLLLGISDTASNFTYIPLGFQQCWFTALGKMKRKMEDAVLDPYIDWIHEAKQLF
jgi:hypothetical protein